jgi:hypothetical protein
VQILRQRWGNTTNTAPTTLRAIQAASQSTFINEQIFSTSLVISRNDKNKQLTIIKPTQTGINRSKYNFCILKSSEPQKNLKNSCVP